MQGGGATAKEYSVITLAPKTVTTNLDFPATIEGQQVIEIRPMISGYIKKIFVNEGDFVKKGQLLFEINNPQYEQEVITAQASIKSAEAEVSSAKMDVEKVKPLVEKEIVSQYQLESAKLTLQAKEASLAQAQATLANAETNLGYTMIKSPQDGLIGTIPYKAGALVSSSSSDALTSLSSIENIFAYFSWDEKTLLDFLLEAKGSTVEEKLDALPPATLTLANGTEYEYKGKIEMASGLISAETGTITLKGVFSNPSGLIRSGASATISIPEKLDSIFIIPQAATYELQDKRFVYKVDSNNKVSSTALTTKPSDDGKFFFISEGLAAGDKVVIEGVASLKSGVEIIPIEKNADNVYGNKF